MSAVDAADTSGALLMRFARPLSVQCGFLWRLDVGLMAGARDGERGEFRSIR